MQGKYDFAMLNKWDGSLTLDENNGTILSTMLGAGHKNEDNSFSGVLIGDLQKGTELNESSALTGVYGLHKGQISYSLTEDGKAIFGKSGNGQIILDGNTSIIQSAGYLNNGKGMKIDLDNGIIDILGEDNQSKIYISPNSNNYFRLRGQHNTLLNIGQGSYYLQSETYSDDNGKVLGTRLDLATGDLDIRSSKGRFFASGSNPNGDSPFLSISLSEDDGLTYTKDLLLISPNYYFLQSKDYTTQTIQTIQGKNWKVYRELPGASPSISTYVALEPINNGLSVNVYKAYLSGAKYYLSSNTPYIFTEKVENNTTVNSEVVKSRYLRKLTPILINGDRTKGFRLDLKNNSLIGYDLLLKGVKGNDINKSFIFDSAADTTPIRVGNNFSVDWDGNVTCNNPVLTGYDGSISLGNFYFNSGGAGGGQWNGGCSGFSGGVLGFKPGNVTSGGSSYRILMG